MVLLMIVVLTYIQYLKYNTPGLKSLTEFIQIAVGLSGYTVHR